MLDGRVLLLLATLQHLDYGGVKSPQHEPSESFLLLFRAQQHRHHVFGASVLEQAEETLVSEFSQVELNGNGMLLSQLILVKSLDELSILLQDLFITFLLD